MANTYTCGNSIDDLMEEEDRECRNDLMRAQTDFYYRLTCILDMVNDVMVDMTDDEIKSMLISPIKKI